MLIMELLYKEAARILSKLHHKEQSVKNLVFNSKFEDKKQLMAVVCGYIKYSDAIDALSYRCTVLQCDSLFSTNEMLQRVFLYEHVIGTGIPKEVIHGKVIKKHADLISNQWNKLMKKRGARNNQDMANTRNDQEAADVNMESVKEILPRWARVNLIKTTVDNAITSLQDGGLFTYVPSPECDYAGFVKFVKNLSRGNFTQDRHFSDVLVFAPGTELYEHSLVLDGNLILQDKASCIPAHILSPTVGSMIIDCCAAPGNKTGHIASTLNNKGYIIAFDYDAERCNTLKQRLQLMGVSCVKAVNLDFLRVDPKDRQYQNVEYILVDPSCSGSGIVNRVELMDENIHSVNNASRIKKLSRFQAMILKRALEFPRVKRVVYSTCSVHCEENEGVVSEVINEYSNSFKLVEILPELPRGSGDYEVGKFCVRMSADSDGTNGFFVAVFERDFIVSENTDKTSDKNISDEVQDAKERIIDDMEIELPTKKSRKRRKKQSSATLNDKKSKLT